MYNTALLHPFYNTSEISVHARKEPTVAFARATKTRKQRKFHFSTHERPSHRMVTYATSLYGLTGRVGICGATGDCSLPIHPGASLSNTTRNRVELWAELCDRNGLTLLATDLRRLHARDGDEQEQGRQADGNNNGSASARASAGNGKVCLSNSEAKYSSSEGARGTKATPSVVAPGRPVTLVRRMDGVNGH